MGDITTSLFHLSNPSWHTCCQFDEETLWDIFPNFSNCQNTLVSRATIFQLQPPLNYAPEVLDGVEVGRVASPLDDLNPPVSQVLDNITMAMTRCLVLKKMGASELPESWHHLLLKTIQTSLPIHTFQLSFVFELGILSVFLWKNIEACLTSSTEPTPNHNTLTLSNGLPGVFWIIPVRTFGSPDKGCVVLLLPEVHNSEHAFVREQNFEPLVGGPVPVSPTKQQPILDHFLCQNRFLGSTTTDQL